MPHPVERNKKWEQLFIRWNWSTDCYFCLSCCLLAVWHRGRRPVCLWHHSSGEIRQSSGLLRKNVCSGLITREMQSLSIRLPVPSGNTNFRSNRAIWKYVYWDFVPLTVPAQRTLRLRRIGAIRSNPISLSMKDWRRIIFGRPTPRANGTGWLMSLG